MTVEKSGAALNKRALTLTWREIPLWQRDNEYIVSGYRRTQNHWTGCLVSVYSYLHNETINIHSHLWGALVFLYLFLTFQRDLLQPFGTTTWKDLLVFSVFLLSAMFCMSASALFHTSTCHSQRVAARCHALDYTGIVVLIVGSFYPCLYYGFFCDSYLLSFYLAMITISGLGAAYIVLNPEYAKPTHRGARTSVFIGLGLSGLLPVSHAVATLGLEILMNDMGFRWLLVSVALYVGGALL